MSERKKIFDLREAFCLVDAVKVINGCGSVLALDALRGVIDRRIAKLERAGGLVEQKGEEKEQKPLESGQTPRKTGQKNFISEQWKPKNEQKKQRGGAHQRIYDENDALKRYGSIKIYKPILDAILGGVKERFTQDDISDILMKHYKDVLKRGLAESSAGSYAFLYVKYMLSEGLIEQDGTLDHKGLGRSTILYRKTLGKIKPEGVKNGIYVDYDDNRKRIKEGLSQERDLCGTGDHDLDVSDG